MAIKYSIKATIIDISSDIPKTEDVFLVDTNVWYWMTYPSAICDVSSKLASYPDYLNKALQTRSTIYHAGLSLAELAHLIERTEHQIYVDSVVNISLKEYRHNITAERSRVVSEIEAAWAQVSCLADPLELTIDEPTTTAAANRLQNENIGGYDLFLLESMKNQGVTQLITDDGDFATIPGIHVFTANRNVINAGRSQGKLVNR